MNTNSQVLYCNLMTVKHTHCPSHTLTMSVHYSNCSRLCMSHRYPSRCFAVLNCPPVSPEVFPLSFPPPMQSSIPFLHHCHPGYHYHFAVPYHPNLQMISDPELTASAVSQKHLILECLCILVVTILVIPVRTAIFHQYISGIIKKLNRLIKILCVY